MIDWIDPLPGGGVCCDPTPRDQKYVGGIMSYLISFYREIVNSQGKRFKTPVYTADVKALGSMDDAIATAIERFKRDRGLSCWSALADGYEVMYERDRRSVVEGQRVSERVDLGGGGEIKK